MCRLYVPLLVIVASFSSSPTALAQEKQPDLARVTERTIAGTNVYMIDSQLLNVQSPKPALSSLMLKLIARVRALR